MLSYVEFYQPTHFQLENVLGLLQYPLNGRQAEHSVVDGIKMGVLKFIKRSLITLGYAFRRSFAQVLD
jgi:DNA (cytosine-5)-methyltransferase 1